MFTLQDRTLHFEGLPIAKVAIPYGEGPDGSTNHRNIDPSVFDSLLRHIVATLNAQVQPCAWQDKDGTKYDLHSFEPFIPKGVDR